MGTQEGFNDFWDRFKRAATTKNVPASVAQRCFPASVLPEACLVGAWSFDKTEHVRLCTYLDVCARVKVASRNGLALVDPLIVQAIANELAVPEEVVRGFCAGCSQHFVCG